MLYAKSLCFLHIVNLIGTNSSLSYINVSRGLYENKIRFQGHIWKTLSHTTHKETYIQGNVYIFLLFFFLIRLCDLDYSEC